VQLALIRKTIYCANFKRYKMINFKKIAKQIGALGGSLASLIQITHMISSEDVPAAAFTFLLVLLGVSGTSSYSLLQDAKKEKTKEELETSKKLVKLISASYGKTTLAELMMQMDMPVPSLKAKLDEMQKDGLLGMEVSNAGEVLYTVSNPLTLADRLDSHKLIN
jgi:hypothetical protein